MVHQQPTTTIAILGGDCAVVENAPALLLEGSGYNIKLLEASSAALADGLLTAWTRCSSLPTLAAVCAAHS